MNAAFELAHAVTPLNYEPGCWNVPGVIGHSNCYGYALNIPQWLSLGGYDEYDRRVGFPGGVRRIDKDGEHVQLAPQDGEDWLPIAGLERVDLYDCDPERHHVIAYDGLWAHFYRLDRHGVWSSKLGGGRVVNIDDFGQPIVNPVSARFNYRAHLERLADVDAHDPNHFQFYRVTERGVKLRAMNMSVL